MPRAVSIRSGDLVACRDCGRAYRAITGSHLKRHRGYGVPDPVERYKRRHPEARICIEEVSRAFRRTNYRRWKRQGRAWSRRRVLAEIRRRAAAGGPLRYNAVVESAGSGLLHAAERRFGSWEAAVRAAGFDYGAIRLLTPWTKEDVIAAIRRLVKERGRAYPKFAKSFRRGLHDAALKRFGSWEAAVRAAGLEPEMAQSKRSWSREGVFRQIRRRMAAGESLTRLYEGGLADAAQKRFGSLRAAVVAAGLNYRWKRRQRVWTKEAIISEVRARDDAGKPLTPGAIKEESNWLYHSARELFGSWYNAVVTAGRIYVPRRVWTRERIVEDLRDRTRRGEPVNAAAIQRVLPGLYKAAVSRFGSWDAALRAVRRSGG